MSQQLINDYNYIDINPFHIKYKDDIAMKCLDSSVNIVLLSNLELNGSYEGGFQLPFTNEWYLLLNKLPNNDLLKYHSHRQLRFVEKDQYIVRLRCKDSLYYWSNDELTAIRDLVNKISKTLC
jgi:hypothetical protein